MAQTLISSPAKQANYCKRGALIVHHMILFFGNCIGWGGVMIFGIFSPINLASPSPLSLSLLLRLLVFACFMGTLQAYQERIQKSWLYNRLDAAIWFPPKQKLDERQLQVYHYYHTIAARYSPLLAMLVFLPLAVIISTVGLLGNPMQQLGLWQYQTLTCPILFATVQGFCCIQQCLPALFACWYDEQLFAE